MNTQITAKRIFRQTGFTLVEIAVVLLIVTILLGYTVALFPIQQELKQYRAVETEMRAIIKALVAHAQVNGRLPCADGDNDGLEDWSAVAGEDCDAWAGTVPARTIGFDGNYSGGVLVDPWGTPYTYQVAPADSTNADAGDAHFILPGAMRAQGIASLMPADPLVEENQLIHVCDVQPATHTAAAPNDETACDANTQVVINVAAVIVSHGKDRQVVVDETSDIQSENLDNSFTDTVFVSTIRNDAAGTEYDDVVKWVSLNQLFSAMIEAADAIAADTGEQVVMQIGMSLTRPSHAAWFDFWPMTASCICSHTRAWLWPMPASGSRLTPSARDAR